ncbi:hypothetical protein ACLB2K_006249 [Fragaria x ananassa]
MFCLWFWGLVWSKWFTSIREGVVEMKDKSIIISTDSNTLAAKTKSVGGLVGRAVRADNFYYPPEWSPNQGSLNKFHGQHALRERAQKVDQGILIIRFEMPYNIWCSGCNSIIAKGVRFNAEKKHVGNYYSTKIWSFTMKAACCKEEIVIQTDQKNCRYVIVSGAQQKTEDFDFEDAETLALPTDDERGMLAEPFYPLEHQEKDLQKKKEAEPMLVRLQRISDQRHLDDSDFVDVDVYSFDVSASGSENVLSNNVSEESSVSFDENDYLSATNQRKQRVNEHSCHGVVRLQTNKMMGSKTIKSIMLDKVHENPNKKAIDIYYEIKSDYGMEVSCRTAWYGKERVRESVLGGDADSYAQLVLFG